MRHGRQDTTFTLMFELGRLVRRRVELGGAGLSLPQLETLHLIEERRPAMGEVAEFLKVAPPSATSLVGELVRADYVRRSAGSRDRRQVSLALTPRGKRALEESVAFKAKVLQELLASLEEKDRAELNRILRRIVESNN